MEMDSPLPPVAVHTVAPFIVKPRLRFAHWSLVLLHLHPGSSGSIEGAPYRDEGDHHQSPIAYDNGWGKVIIIKMGWNVLLNLNTILVMY